MRRQATQSIVASLERRSEKMSFLCLRLGHSLALALSCFIYFLFDFLFEDISRFRLTHVEDGKTKNSRVINERRTTTGSAMESLRCTIDLCRAAVATWIVFVLVHFTSVRSLTLTWIEVNENALLGIHRDLNG